MWDVEFVETAQNVIDAQMSERGFYCYALKMRIICYALEVRIIFIRSLYLSRLYRSLEADIYWAARTLV